MKRLDKYVEVKQVAPIDSQPITVHAVVIKIFKIEIELVDEISKLADME